MPVIIDELVSRVDVVGREGTISPELMAELVSAVILEIERRKQEQERQSSQTETESVVKQQRRGVR